MKTFAYQFTGHIDAISDSDLESLRRTIDQIIEGIVLAPNPMSIVLCFLGSNERVFYSSLGLRDVIYEKFEDAAAMTRYVGQQLQTATEDVCFKDDISLN